MAEGIKYFLVGIETHEGQPPTAADIEPAVGDGLFVLEQECSVHSCVCAKPPDLSIPTQS